MTRTWYRRGGRRSLGVYWVGEGGVAPLTALRFFSGGSMPGLWRQRLPSAWALLLLPFLRLLMPAAPAPHRGSYKPVIVVHGLFDSSYSFRHLLDYINEVCQGPPGRGCWRSSCSDWGGSVGS